MVRESESHAWAEIVRQLIAAGQVACVRQDPSPAPSTIVEPFLSVAPEAYAFPALFFGWMVFAGPAIGGLGAA
jgi:hypothetical protein